MDVRWFGSIDKGIHEGVDDAASPSNPPTLDILQAIADYLSVDPCLDSFPGSHSLAEGREW